MKAIIAVVLLMALFTVPAFAQEAPLAGGWSIVEDTAVPEEAREALTKALEELVGADYEPVALLGTQVVAGLNYCLLCKITPVVPNPVPHYALVWLYKGVDGTAKILEVQDLSVQLPETVGE